MNVHSSGEEPPEPGERKKRKYPSAGPGGNLDMFKDEIFTKLNYKRLFLENIYSEFTVCVESTENEKMGSRRPITLTNLISDYVKGVLGVHRMNKHKMGINFGKAVAANNFLKMENFFWKNKMKSFIPSYLTEKNGVIS